MTASCRAWNPGCRAPATPTALPSDTAEPGLTFVRSPVPATIDIDPNTLNLKSEGDIITAFIELPEGFDVSDIDPSSILLNGSVPAIGPATIGNYDLDGVPDLMVKFDRVAVQEILDPGDGVEITITGQIDGTDFVGTDTIKVIDVGVRHRSEDASSVAH